MKGFTGNPALLSDRYLSIGIFIAVAVGITIRYCSPSEPSIFTALSDGMA